MHAGGRIKENLHARANTNIPILTHHEVSREKWRKCISVTGSLRGQAQVRPVDKMDEACTNADDRMMLVQHYSADRVMN